MAGGGLVFCDGLARLLMQPLEDGVTKGIRYRVRVRKVEKGATTRF